MWLVTVGERNVRRKWRKSRSGRARRGGLAGGWASGLAGEAADGETLRSVLLTLPILTSAITKVRKGHVSSPTKCFSKLMVEKRGQTATRRVK